MANVLTRRRFLQTADALAGAALVYSAAPRPARAASAVISPQRLGLLTDLTLCIGCRACEAACNKVNNLPAPEVPLSSTAVFDTLRRPTARAFTVVNRYQLAAGRHQAEGLCSRLNKSGTTGNGLALHRNGKAVTQ